MTGDIFRWIVSGFLAPQTTVRDLLGNANGYEVAAQLFVFGFLIEAISVVMFGVRPDQGSMIAGHISNLVASALALGLLVFLVFQLGRLSGGIGSLKDTVIGVSWYSMMNALLAPFVVMFLAEISKSMVPPADGVAAPGFPDIPTGMLMSVMFAGMTSIWLFANTIAAIHGFRNLWGVIGVIVGIPFALVVMVTMMAGGAGS
ncbi:MAG: YIP1 family protein [Paracoccaceae bacterium]